MIQHSITFRGINSADFGVTITGMKNTIIPKWEGAYFPIPGKNGDFYAPSDRMSNVEITYSCAITENFSENYSNFINAISEYGTSPGYSELMDSAFPDVFRMAILDKQAKVTLLPNAVAGKFDLTFTCKPQRFLMSGNRIIQVENRGRTIIENPGQTAKPLITVYAAGTGCSGQITVNGRTIYIINIDDEITLDCENQTAFRQHAGQIIPMNDHIMAEEFPTLVPHDNIIDTVPDAIGDFLHIELVPRWWII